MRFNHVPHMHIRHRKTLGPVKTEDQHSGLNGRIAVWITNHVGTMYCAYLFAMLGGAGIFGALTSSVELVLIVGAISGYFLQLVLLPIIIVGQNVQAQASDKRAQATYDDAEAVLHETQQLQNHMHAQDEELTKQTEALADILAHTRKS